MRKILLQTTREERDANTRLLEATTPIHKEYSALHGFEYVVQVFKSCSANYWQNYWQKHYAINSLLLNKEAGRELDDGDFIAYLDNDAMIVDSSCDLETALSSTLPSTISSSFQYDIGLVKCNSSVERYYGKYDVGVMLIRVSPNTRKLFSDMARARPLPPPKEHIDKLVFNEILQRNFKVRLKELDARFNNYPGAFAPLLTNKGLRGPEIIRAWHGMNKQLTCHAIKHTVRKLRVISREFQAPSL